MTNLYEIWKDIKGYGSLYQISNCGRVKSLRRKNSYRRIVKERILKFGLNSSGYYNVNLYLNNRRITIGIHRLVAEAFIPNPENKPEVNHKDGIKTHNEDYNLEWCTSKENHAHKNEVLKKHTRGENNGRFKLTDVQIYEIKKLLKTSNLFQKEIAKIFNVTQSYISQIKLNKIRK